MNQKALTHFTAKPKTVEERFAAGKAMRMKHPISKLGEYTPSPKRVDPVSILEKQGKTRLPDLVPIRYARMLTSPFAFHDPNTVNLDNAVDYCKLCAWALAQAHAKSGDAAMIAGYAGKSEHLDDAMVQFAFAYAEQNEKDYNALKVAVDSGRIKVAKAEPGVTE